MRSRGFQEVYQLDVGVVRYGERFGDSGLWEGSLYVFDGRGSSFPPPSAATIGRCAGCGEASSRMRNCVEAACREQLVVCEVCGTSACPEHAAAEHAATGERVASAG